MQIFVSGEKISAGTGSRRRVWIHCLKRNPSHNKQTLQQRENTEPQQLLSLPNHVAGYMYTDDSKYSCLLCLWFHLLCNSEINRSDFNTAGVWRLWLVRLPLTCYSVFDVSNLHNLWQPTFYTCHYSFSLLPKVNILIGNWHIHVIIIIIIITSSSTSRLFVGSIALDRMSHCVMTGSSCHSAPL